MIDWLKSWWNGNSTQGKTNQGGNATEEVIDLKQLSQNIETQGDDTKNVTSDDIKQQQPLESTVKQDDDALSDISDDDRDFIDAEEHPDGMSKEEYCTLQKEAKEKFGEYIKNIDEVYIGRSKDGNLYATIELQNNDTNIKVREFLDSKFCKDNKITGFSILNANKEKIVSGYVEKVDEKEVRHYNLGTTGTHGMQFKWSVDGRECSIILTANSDGSIKIVGDKPTDKDLEENTEVRINVGGCYVTLADAVRGALKVQNQPSAEDQPQPKVSKKAVHSELSQPVVEKKTQLKEEPSISPK